MTALPKLRWMALPIAVGWGVINLSPEPAAVPDTSIKTLNEWSEEPAELPPQTAHTVDPLLLLMGTKDCAAADAFLEQPAGNTDPRALGVARFKALVCLYPGHLIVIAQKDKCFL